MNSSSESAYAAKDLGYFENARSELLPFVPANARRVLDIGCGAGRFGGMLRETRGCEVWGVEPEPRAAALAEAKLTRVLVGLFAPTLPLPEAQFDLVCFNDVLEHMPEPELALSAARRLLAPGGRVLASVPNFRHFNNLWELVVRGHATYRASGVMDKTHLRIFTMHSVRELFESCGYQVERVEGINAQHTWRPFRFFNAVTLGRIRDMRWLQIAVVARASS